MLAVKKQIRQLGFTLIELMVVIAIIGLLMAAGLVSYTNAQKNARDAKRTADNDSVAQAEEQYAASNGGSYLATTSYALFAPGTTYFSQGVPADPTTAANYSMVAGPTGYCVCAKYEQTGKGNATAIASTATCTFSTATPPIAAGAQGYYCRQNQQ